MAYFSCSDDANNTSLPKIPHDWFYIQRAYPNGKIDHSKYIAALKWRQALKNEHKGIVGKWSEEGPSNIGGRITDIEMHASDTLTIFAATASGGIFRSHDQGINWSPIFDDALSLSIGDIAIADDNPNIIYAGTGESNAGGSSLAYDGVGIYRSEDGGNNWSHIGLEKVGSIGRVMVHPSQSNIVYVAAMGNLFGDNLDRGVYKTTDGGLTWENILFISDQVGAIDFVIDPEDPDIIYTATWERVRRTNFRKYGGAGSDIYKSIDGGSTWIKLTNGLPQLEEDKGRIGLAISPTQSNILYASYADAEGRLTGIFKSIDSGGSWVPINVEGIFAPPFMWWFGKIEVHPNDPHKIYFTSLQPYASNSAVAPDDYEWKVIFPETHVDQHAIFVHPINDQLIINGNDGGVFISHDAGSNYFKAQNLPITQLYNCDLDPHNSLNIYAGSQDNGMIFNNASDDQWEELITGDGFNVLLDPVDQNSAYATLNRGSFYKTNNRFEDFEWAISGIENTDRKNWRSPFLLDPYNENTLYSGTQFVYKSTDKAENWAKISPDLSNGNQSMNITFGTISCLELGGNDSQLLYAGTDDGNVWNSLNGGTDWNQIDSDLFPNAWVTSIAIDPKETKSAYVCFSGYRTNTNEGHVFKSNDEGQTWTDISFNLIDIPVNDILVHPLDDILFIASDIGVFYLEQFSDEWKLLGDNLPNVVASDLQLNTEDNKLYVATYGRSLHSFDLSQLTINHNNETHLSLISISPNPFKDYLILNETKPSVRKIKVYNSNGVLQSQFKVENSSPTIQLTPLNPGCYFIVLLDSNNQIIHSAKAVKI